MERRDSSMYIGGLIILLGIILLLQNLGLFGPLATIVWISLFGLGGLAMLGVAFYKAERWWALIPAMLMISIAVLISVHQAAPAFGERWGGTVFLGGLSLAFWAIPLRSRTAWWAVIPAGVITTLAVVAGFDQVSPGPIAGGTLFAGIALTFGLVYLLRRNHEHTAWALIVTGVMLLMSIATLSASVTFVGLLWPALMMIGGLALILRAIRQSRRESQEDDHGNPALPQSH